MWVGQFLKFLCKNPKAELTFFVMLEIYFPQSSFSLIVNPRYCTDETCFIILESM